MYVYQMHLTTFLPYNYCFKNSTWPTTNGRFESCYVCIGNYFLKCHY